MGVRYLIILLPVTQLRKKHIHLTEDKKGLKEERSRKPWKLRGLQSHLPIPKSVWANSGLKCPSKKSLGTSANSSGKSRYFKSKQWRFWAPCAAHPNHCQLGQSPVQDPEPGEFSHFMTGNPCPHWCSAIIEAKSCPISSSLQWAPWFVYPGKGRSKIICFPRPPHRQRETCQAFLGMCRAMQSRKAFDLLCMDAEILSETSLHEITAFPRDISVFLLVTNVDAVCPLKWKCSAKSQHPKNFPQGSFRNTWFLVLTSLSGGKYLELRKVFHVSQSWMSSLARPLLLIWLKK